MSHDLKLSKDGIVSFREHDHCYRFTRDGDPSKGEKFIKNEKLLSCTTLIGQYHDPFDPDGSITENFAKKHGFTVEEIQLYYKVENKISTVMGSEVHLIMENHIMKIPQRVPRKYQWIINEFDNISFSGILKPELLLYSKDYKLSGQSDLCELVTDPITKKKKIIIWDYKTNKILEKENLFGNYMIRGLDYVPDTNYFHYCIQLSLYRKLFELQGVEVGEQNIIYVNKYTRKLEVHPCPYMEKEVNLMLSNRLKEINDPSYVPVLVA